ncbi:NlpC/P60 family protein, partial [Saccharothrix longispora]|nr:NlpC/P60 family protein [Saccharothrix longispora]
MDVAGFLAGLVRPMEDHLARLEGDTGAASGAADAFGRASSALTEVDGRHTGAANAALATWYGEKANAFQERVSAFSGGLGALARNATATREAVTTAVDAVTSGRTAIRGLIDEFTGWAWPRLAAAAAASVLGGTGAVLAVAAEVTAKAREYEGKTGQELERVRGELTAVVALLQGLRQPDFAGLGAPLGAEGGTTSVSSVDDGGSGSGNGSGNGSGPGSGSGPGAG